MTTGINNPVNTNIEHQHLCHWILLAVVKAERRAASRTVSWSLAALLVARDQLGKPTGLAVDRGTPAPRIAARPQATSQERPPRVTGRVDLHELLTDPSKSDT